MKHLPLHKFLPGVILAGAILHESPACACAACFGKADGPLADGMNWGIMSLLVTIVFVLGGFASFFIYLARKSAAVARAASTEPAPQPEILAVPQKA